jgi:hypothetical protein
LSESAFGGKREKRICILSCATERQAVAVGQYSGPVRMVAFNTAERWSEDVSADVAEELRRRCDLQMRELPSTISDFVERHEMPDRRQLTLRLV